MGDRVVGWDTGRGKSGTRALKGARTFRRPGNYNLVSLVIIIIVFSPPAESWFLRASSTRLVDVLISAPNTQ